MKAKSLMPEAKKRRYFLHKVLKPFLKIDVRKRTIYTSENMELSDESRVYLKELISFGYMCQIEIFEEPVQQKIAA